jgi:hypothetical protein
MGARVLLAVGVLLGVATTARAATFAYVGTYTGRDSRGIYQLQLAD